MIIRLKDKEKIIVKKDFPVFIDGTYISCFDHDGIARSIPTRLVELIEQDNPKDVALGSQEP